VSIGPFAIVGEGTEIGDNCTLSTGVVVGRYCKLGENVCLYPHVVLYDDTVIGNRVTIHANAVIGADGFGYREQNGRHTKIPQQGWVEVEDDVEVAGRLISIFILAVLYIVGFIIIGLKNGIILGAIAAIFTFIPYVGPFIGGLVPFFMAVVSGSFNIAFWVVVVITLAQLFDNYFIEPYFVGGAVNISAFFAIFILILGGVIWGIAGVILFLPMLGIVKIVFENVEGLHPFAYLIGDQEDALASTKIWSRIMGLFRQKNN
jgi:hypothetical protein